MIYSVGLSCMHQNSKLGRIRIGYNSNIQGMDFTQYSLNSGSWNISLKNGISKKTAILLTLNKGFEKILTTHCGMSGGEGNDVFLALMTSVYNQVKIQELSKALIFKQNCMILTSQLISSRTLFVGHLRDKIHESTGTK